MKVGCWTLLFIAAHAAYAQPPCAFDLGADTALCPGATLVLNAPGGLGSYAWNTGDTTASILVAAAGTYVCTVIDAASSQLELITNGDFSQGSIGFTSDYTEPTVEGPFGLLSDESQYSVTTDPNLAHIDFYSCADHTTGTGNMMVVNGAATPGVDIWCQTVSVDANTDYTFSAWLMTAFPANPATLGFSINGVSIGSPLTAPSTPCEWQQFAAAWNSGTATSATVCIVNLNTEIFGNDFALDDISFTGPDGGTCTYTDSIAVSVTAVSLDLGPDTALCPGNAVTLVADPGVSDVTWSSGQHSTSITVSAPGTYWLTGLEEQCPVTDTVIVEGHPPLPLPGTATVLLCPGAYVDLLAGDNGSVSFLWNTGAASPVIQVQEAGIYTVIITGACDERTDTVAVIGDDCETTLFVPNAFTPNDDGQNDHFVPVVRGMIAQYAFDIYDRWGERIFHSEQQGEEWDGTYKGVPVQDGVYVWKLRYRNAEGVQRERRDLYGHVTVLR